MVVIESEKYREGKMATGLQTDSRSDTGVKISEEAERGGESRVQESGNGGHMAGER